MSEPRIIPADEARKLLNDASVDDWTVGPLTGDGGRYIMSDGAIIGTFYLHMVDAEPLVAAAPDLAHTVIDHADRIARLEDELHHVTQHAHAQGRKLRAKELQAQRLQGALRAGLGAHALDVNDLIRDGHLTEEDMQ